VKIKNSLPTDICLNAPNKPGAFFVYAHQPIFINYCCLPLFKKKINCFCDRVNLLLLLTIKQVVQCIKYQFKPIKPYQKALHGIEIKAQKIFQTFTTIPASHDSTYGYLRLATFLCHFNTTLLQVKEEPVQKFRYFKKVKGQRHYIQFTLVKQVK